MFPQPPQLEPVIPPDDFLHPDTWFLGSPLLWLILVFVGALIVFFFIRSKKRIVPLPPPSQINLADDRLDSLLASNSNLHESATELSLIIRNYLSYSSKDPVLYETHIEFSRRPDALMNIPEGERLPICHLLDRMAQLKYSANTPNDKDQVKQLVQETRELLHRIDSVLNQPNSETLVNPPKH